MKFKIDDIVSHKVHIHIMKISKIDRLGQYYYGVVITSKVAHYKSGDLCGPIDTDFMDAKYKLCPINYNKYWAKLNE